MSHTINVPVIILIIILFCLKKKNKAISRNISINFKINLSVQNVLNILMGTGGPFFKTRNEANTKLKK